MFGDSIRKITESSAPLNLSKKSFQGDNFFESNDDSPMARVFHKVPMTAKSKTDRRFSKSARFGMKYPNIRREFSSLFFFDSNLTRIENDWRKEKMKEMWWLQLIVFGADWFESRNVFILEREITFFITNHNTESIPEGSRGGRGGNCRGNISREAEWSGILKSIIFWFTLR